MISALHKNGRLANTIPAHVYFGVGAGTGTLAAHSIFILGGLLARDFFQRNQDKVNIAFGIFFLILAVLQGIKMIKKSRQKDGNLQNDTAETSSGNS
jgi:hypothetical protein